MRLELADYPFLSERSTDRSFLSEYARLFPATRPPSASNSPFRKVEKKFVIGFTARVGSTLLCQQLFRYGVFVAEFFNPVHLKAETHVQAVADAQALCSRLVSTHAVKGAWGVKAFIQSTIPLFLVGEFPDHIHSWRFVYLTRDNIVQQAISHVIAELTQSWSSWEQPKRELSADDYSYDQIERAIWSTRLSQTSWETFFRTYQIEPLRISFERIVADPEATAAEVAEYCNLKLGGQELVAQFDDPPLKRQTTGLNAIWEERFRSELSAFSVQISP
jgi:LPS sulfotransferase NodH